MGALWHRSLVGHRAYLFQDSRLGFCLGYVYSRSKDAQVNKERGEKGTLIASGFIAGGALMGVVSALLKFGGIEVSVADSWWTNPLSEVCSLIAYALLITYFVKATKK